MLKFPFPNKPLPYCIRMTDDSRLEIHARLWKYALDLGRQGKAMIDKER